MKFVSWCFFCVLWIFTYKLFRMSKSQKSFSRALFEYAHYFTGQKKGLNPGIQSFCQEGLTWWDEHVTVSLSLLSIVSTILAAGRIPFIMNQAMGRSKFGCVQHLAWGLDFGHTWSKLSKNFSCNHLFIRCRFGLNICVRQQPNATLFYLIGCFQNLFHFSSWYRTTWP